MWFGTVVLVLVIGSWLFGACGGGPPSGQAPAVAPSAPRAPAPAAPASAAGGGPAVGRGAEVGPAGRAPLQKLTLAYSPVEASSTPLWLGA